VSGYERSETPLIKNAASQLDEYFTGLRKAFDLPLSLKGTEFQRSVWNALLTVGYGETRSYKDIAAQIGKPLAVRAVGSANHHNPIAIIVPCHRVIGHDGSLTGYGGGLHVKQFLLDLEKRDPSAN
jgi:methylated-DNA-[protein]-cysteine S-methyltransferase